MKLIPYEMGGEVCGWHSDDAARLYWYKSEHPGSDRAPTAPERLTAYVIGHTGIVMGEHVIVEVAALDFLGAGLFGEGRPCSFNSAVKWTGDSYRYGIYAVNGHAGRHVIIRNDGGGIYVYLDAGHTDWNTLCSLLPPERLWDLCQVIGHTYHQGRDHERQRLYRLFAQGGIKRTKIRGQNAYRIIETPSEQRLQLA
jgi:hypothetical protein